MAVREGLEEASSPQQAHEKFLSFDLDGEVYGFALGDVAEIMRLQRITPVPGVPSFLRGVINLRGTVVPVTDIRLRLGLGEREHDDRTCIVVVHAGGERIGVIVDTVREVVDVPTDRIQRNMAASAEDAAPFITGLGRVEDRVTILLDARKLLEWDPAEPLPGGARS